MTSKKTTYMCVDNLFAKKLKSEAAWRGEKIIEYTKKLGKSANSLSEEFKENKEKRKGYRFEI